MTDVVVLKLSSGEEVIARANNTGHGWQVTKPRLVVMAPTPQGIQIAIMPWIAADVDGKYLIDDKHVITSGKPTDNLEKQYLEQTSGLEIVKG